MPRHHHLLSCATVAALTATVAWSTTTARAQTATKTVATTATFAQLQEQLTKAVEANKMIIVTKACASCGAARRDVTIPGNIVLGVYRSDFAVRMLEASVPAGIEAPIRLYITENADGSASLSYQMPSAVFAPYGSADLDAMAQELDQIWQKIVADTVGK
jgi:uncharacterized protein (DUF302 family)